MNLEADAGILGYMQGNTLEQLAEHARTEGGLPRAIAALLAGSMGWNVRPEFFREGYHHLGTDGVLIARHDGGVSVGRDTRLLPNHEKVLMQSEGGITYVQDALNNLRWVITPWNVIVTQLNLSNFQLPERERIGNLLAMVDTIIQGVGYTQYSPGLYFKPMDIPS